MSFSAAIRKARELGGRSLALARGPFGMVIPRAAYPPRPALGVLVLQRGDNPTTDYYLRPRLEKAGLPYEITDLDSPPAASDQLANGKDLLVILCRYANASWLETLARQRGRICRLAYFTDDDLPAMVADPDLPVTARGKVAAHFGRHVDRIGQLASEVWVSTPRLAELYPDSRAAVLPPLPEADPPPPAPPDERLVVYHGSDVHGPERQFALEVMRRMRALGSDAPFEITGNRRTVGVADGIAGLTVTPQLAWPRYLARQHGRTAAVSLAPLLDSAVNAARAPVKAFDAARLGAAGVYASREPYGGFVTDKVDGLLLGDDAQAWAHTVVALLDNPARRWALADAARGCLRRLLETDAGFPAGPEA